MLGTQFGMIELTWSSWFCSGGWSSCGSSRNDNCWRDNSTACIQIVLSGT